MLSGRAECCTYRKRRQCRTGEDGEKKPVSLEKPRGRRKALCFVELSSPRFLLCFVCIFVSYECLEYRFESQTR